MTPNFLLCFWGKSVKMAEEEENHSVTEESL